ncbi:MAG: endolytic transglycosylase MltG [Oscillospiraceae bacterium]
MSDEKKSGFDSDNAYLDLLNAYSKDEEDLKEKKAKEDLHSLVAENQKKKSEFKVNLDKVDMASNSSQKKAPEKPSPIFFSPKKAENALAEKRSKLSFNKKTAEPSANQPQRRIIRRPDGQLSEPMQSQHSNATIIRENPEKFDVKSIEKFFKQNKLAWVLVLACIVFAILISTYTISCANDILAINRKAGDPISITIPNDAKTKDILNILKDNKLISHKYFCGLVSSVMGYSDDKYLAGIYTITPETGLGFEKMLTRFKSAQITGETVTLSFPEGYSVDQIAAKLEKYEVCTAQQFYTTLRDIDFSADYEFIKAIGNKNERYLYVEGYLYPDTYDFYVGETATSVIKKFLDNFKEKWTTEYDAQARKMNMSIDDVVRLASIVEKEAYGAAQMPKVSSVLHNRLNKSGLYPTLQCDATTAYINTYISKRVTSSTELSVLTSKYSTKKCEGLPIGAICNPGNDAIKSALFPEKTDFYFFLHDNDKKLYLARNDAEHQKNGIDALKANNASKNKAQ